jgi:hypothetical protein
MLLDIEHENKLLTDRNIKLICLEFKVNRDWLLTGQGEMFDSFQNPLPPSTLIIADRRELPPDVEVDVLLENGDSVLVVEIKADPSREDVNDHIKRIDPEYAPGLKRLPCPHCMEGGGCQILAQKEAIIELEPILVGLVS